MLTDCCKTLTTALKCWVEMVYSLPTQPDSNGVITSLKSFYNLPEKLKLNRVKIHDFLAPVT